VSEILPLPSKQPHFLDEWVLKTAGKAVAYATSLMHDQAEAEDLVQDCYVRLLAKANEYDLLRDGVKLLYKSVSNACFTRLKQRRRHVQLRVDHDGADPWQALADSSSSDPCNRLSSKELQEAVADCLAKLPPLQRAAIELKSLGHTQQEVAEILGITATNAGVIIHRARHTLAACLQAKGEMLLDDGK
jgi:RNA polymerase sigma factor (sigma-70 family)